MKRALVRSDLTEVSTDELARLSRLGDSQAFAALATRIRPRIVDLLRRRLNGQEADAEDIAQVTLTKAWANIQRYDVNQPFAGWVTTIAIRSATDHLRQQKRRLQRAQEVAAQKSTAAQPVVQTEARNIWAVAKRLLSKSQYSALWLRYGEEFSVQEIADSLGKTQVATRVILCRARARLQSHLKSEAPL